MLDKEIGIRQAVANNSDVLAVYIDRLETAKSTTDRAADDILRNDVCVADECLCSGQLGIPRCFWS